MGTVHFHRAARVLPQLVEPEEGKLPSPPRLPPPDHGAFSRALTTVLPMVAMVGGMGFMLLYPSSLTMKLMIGGMVMLMAAGGIVTKLLHSRLEKRRRVVDAGLYREHLVAETKRLTATAATERSSLLHVHPDPHVVFDRVGQLLHLWARQPSDTDFLDVRIGHGDTPAAVTAHLEINRDPTVQFDPALHAEAKDLEQRHAHLTDAPITLSLSHIQAMTVVGTSVFTYGLIRSMLCQLAAAHAPEEVRIGAFMATGSREQLAWLRWLPHVRGDERDPLRRGDDTLLTTNVEDFGLMLEREIRTRLAASRAGAGAKPPHLVLIVDGYQPDRGVGQLPSLRRVLARHQELGMTVLTVVGEQRLEPSRTQVSVFVNDDGGFAIHERAGVGRTERRGIADSVDVAQAERMARQLAPLRSTSDSHDAEGALSSNLFNLLGFAGPDHVDPRTSWRPRKRSQVMATPLGVAATGRTLVLDLKEAAAGGMGPHGLVIGATGSGKSELLRTLITGLAVTHPPDVLSFVFADFKGGAAFSDLAQLPHVAGMITNLQDDQSRVDRMYSALVGEQERRQQLLRDAGNVDGIKEYQALYSQNPGLEPMPYLMIVVDEFGELLVARPDFSDLFNAIGRVGRSLGMHLLLASQRLEESKLRGLEGHLRYRICLRTFSEADSRAVLGTTDAYALPSEPGSGYFKVDSDIYEQFQVALVTAPFHATSAEDTAETLVAPFDGMFHPARDVKADQRDEERPAGGRTEMEAAIDRLQTGLDARHRRPHQVWLPPLPDALPLNQAFARAHDEHGARYEEPRPLGLLRVAVGVQDRPLEQRQSALILDFAGVDGHLAVVGASQSGKSTFLRTLVGSLALTHSPDDVQVYAIDFGGGSLRSLAALPHVGAVCDKLERERIQRLMRQIHSSMAERTEVFRQLNVDSIATFRRLRDQHRLPSSGADILLLIDNLGQLRAEFPDFDQDLLPLLSTGLGYGVHIVLTAARWADIRPNIRDHIAARVEFHLNDPTESEMPRGAAAHLPALAGRGLTRGGLHFQTSLPRIDTRSSVSDMAAGLENLIEVTSRRWQSGGVAPPLRLLPTAIAASEIPACDQGIAIGLEENDLRPVGIDLFSRDPHFLIFGDSESGKSNLIRNWVAQAARSYTADQVKFVLVDYRRSLLDVCDEAHLHSYAANAPLAKIAIEQLKAELTERLPGADVTRDQLLQRSWWQGPEYVVVVDDYDLVASPSGNPLQPLLDLLAQGRDVGFHLLLARRVGGTTRSAFEAVLQRMRELGVPGLVMSGEPSEGTIIGSQRASLLPPGRGYLVRRGQRSTMIQTALASPSAETSSETSSASMSA